jgi:two-component system, sensor histidine kinase and response regulator
VIFQPFVQTDTGIRHANGTGLGLAIARHLAEAPTANSGSRANPATGQRFISCCRARPLADWQARSKRPMDTDNSILYVEDDPLSRQVMQLIVETVMQVRSLVIFENTDNVMSRIRALIQRPDIILLDVQVTPMNGLDVLKLVRAEPELSTTRVVALTASVMNEEIEQLRDCGFDGTISKPLSVTTLPGLIERALDGEAIWHVI